MGFQRFTIGDPGGDGGVVVEYCLEGSTRLAVNVRAAGPSDPVFLRLWKGRAVATKWLGSSFSMVVVDGSNPGL